MPPDESKLRAKLLAKLAKDLLRRGFKVQNEARRLLGGARGHPKRVSTGRLRSSVSVQLRTHAGRPAVRVGTNVRYASYVRRGTGIYGPRRQRIVPKRAKALVFPSARYGARRGKFAGKVVVRSVKGMRGNDFLRPALRAARD